MSIAAASARYAAAALVAPTAPEAGVEVHMVEWPAMRRAVTLLRELRRRSQDGVSVALEELTPIVHRAS